MAFTNENILLTFVLGFFLVSLYVAQHNFVPPLIDGVDFDKDFEKIQFDGTLSNGTAITISCHLVNNVEKECNVFSAFHYDNYVDIDEIGHYIEDVTDDERLFKLYHKNGTVYSFDKDVCYNPIA